MNTTAIHQAPQQFEYEFELEGHLTEHFDDIVAATGLELLLVGHQPRLPGNRADLLALDQDGKPWLIELKIGAATPDAVTQLLRYSHAISAMTREDFLALPNNTGATADLEQRFETKFGRSFNINPTGTPGMALVAKSFKPATAQALIALQGHGAPVRAYRYIGDEGSQPLRLEPIDAEELSHIALQESEPSAVALNNPKPATEPDGEMPELAVYRVHIRDEVKQFWEEFCATYQHPVAPIALIVSQYAVWSARQNTGVLPQLPDSTGNLGILAREIKTLALENDEWVRIFYRQDCPVQVAAQANPSSPLEARLRRGYPYTRAAYARPIAFDTHVALVA